MPVARVFFAILCLSMLAAFVLSVAPFVVLVLVVIALKRAHYGSWHRHRGGSWYSYHHQRPVAARAQAQARPRPAPSPTRAQVLRMRSSVADLLLDVDGRVTRSEDLELRARYQEASRLYIKASKGLELGNIAISTLADDLIAAKWHLDSINAALSSEPAPALPKQLTRPVPEAEISYA